MLLGGVGAIGGVVGLVLALRNVDTDAPTRFAMNVLLWPTVTPVLWIAEAALLSVAYKACAKLSTVRATWIVSALATVAIIGVGTWLFWMGVVSWLGNPASAQPS